MSSRVLRMTLPADLVVRRPVRAVSAGEIQLAGGGRLREGEGPILAREEGVGDSDSEVWGVGGPVLQEGSGDGRGGGAGGGADEGGADGSGSLRGEESADRVKVVVGAVGEVAEEV